MVKHDAIIPKLIFCLHNLNSCWVSSSCSKREVWCNHCWFIRSCRCVVVYIVHYNFIYSFSEVCRSKRNLLFLLTWDKKKKEKRVRSMKALWWFLEENVRGSLCLDALLWPLLVFKSSGGCYNHDICKFILVSRLNTIQAFTSVLFAM